MFVVATFIPRADEDKHASCLLNTVQDSEPLMNASVWYADAQPTSMASITGDRQSRLRATQ